MRFRALVLLLLAIGLVAALPGVAMAHPAEAAWNGTYSLIGPDDVPVLTDPADVSITRQSENVEFVASVPIAATSDMQFQRRQGRQVWNGVVVEDSHDIVVMGGTGDPGLSIIDITDPRQPVPMVTVTCGGFHSDVAVYENYVIQAWDGRDVPCAPDEPADPNGIDATRAGRGLRIFDITDPWKPVLVATYGSADGIPAGVHNITVNGEAGLVYLNMAEFNAVDPPWGYVDLEHPDLPLTIKSIRDWSPTAADGCHDSGLAPARDLYACAGITATYIWDMSDPRNPTEVSVIPNPAINIHHGARWTPDEQTLVLGDETAGAASGTPEAVCTGGKVAQNPVGATWFYNASVPEAPLPTGVFSATDTEGEYCTSHFYGFVDAESSLMVAGWYDAGIEIVDYTPLADGLTGAPTSHAVFEPEDSGFFSAYAWHGFVYGSSFEYGATGGSRETAGRGLWVIEVEGIGDVEPLATDEGNTWGRWSSEVTEVEVGLLAAVAADGGLVTGGAHTELPTDALALGVVALGATALVPRRRR